ncbi:TPA: putative phage abortive infection protein [Acinetobacter baumannii]
MSKNKKDSEVERKERRWQNIEIISIFATLVLIACIWNIYPDALREIDQDKTPITVPFKQNNATNLPYDEKKSYAEKIGEKYGAYGDAYGSLNTLFSGWAFALLLISLFMQRRELQEQRKELAAQRDEISKANEIAESQRNITKQQSELLAQQSFYSLLFKLLDEKNNKINLFYINDSVNQKVYEKHECFKFYSKNILRSFDAFTMHNTSEMSPSEIRENYKNFIKIFYRVASDRSDNIFEATLYFELIINILDLIDKQANQKNIESDIVFLKSYISHDELIIIAAYGFINTKLYRYINKYGLLANFDSELYETPYQTFAYLYDTNAFRPFTQKEAA